MAACAHPSPHTARVHAGVKTAFHAAGKGVSKGAQMAAQGAVDGAVMAGKHAKVAAQGAVDGAQGLTKKSADSGTKAAQQAKKRLEAAAKRLEAAAKRHVLQQFSSVLKLLFFFGINASLVGRHAGPGGCCGFAAGRPIRVAFMRSSSPEPSIHKERRPAHMLTAAFSACPAPQMVWLFVLARYQYTYMTVDQASHHSALSL